MKCEFGYCSVCEKDISQKCPSCEAKRPGPEYTEVQVEWSNGSKMQIAVCLDCALSHLWSTSEAKRGLTEEHWAYWDKKGQMYDKAVVIV